MEELFNVNQRIKDLCKQQNMTFYRLSKISNIPPSTLTNIYNRGTVPSVGTLENICRALGITLSEFFTTSNDSFDLSAEQKELLDIYIQLPKDDKERVMAYVQGLQKVVPKK